MTSFVSKNDLWHKENLIKNFRTKKSAIAYMDDRPYENWSMIDYSALPNKALGVFLCEEKMDIMDVCKIYQNNLNQHIRIHMDFDGCLYDCNINDYILNSNILDSENSSIIRCFFGHFNFVYDMENLDEIICFIQGVDIGHNFNKDLLKKMNNWAVLEEKENMEPIYCQEKYYAYLILVVGETIRRNKILELSWHTDELSLMCFDGNRYGLNRVLMPFLKNDIGEKFDIVQAFREYLFYKCGNFKNVFTNIYNNIEKYKVS